MKKKIISIVIIVLVTILVTVQASAFSRLLFLQKQGVEYGIATYILTDKAMGGEYIVVQDANGIAITPRINK